MKHAYIRKDDRKPFSAIQWTGDNVTEVYEWARSNSKKKRASVATTHYTHLGSALFVQIDDQEESVGAGAWLVWRDNYLRSLADDPFRAQFVPLERDGILGAIAENRARDENTQQVYSGSRGGGKTDALRAQANVGAASQGIVEPQKCEGQAKLRHIVRSTDSVRDLEHVLNSAARDGYDYLDWGGIDGDKNDVFVIFKRRD